ncbi:MerR family transcriptional regulator [Pseudactinotalea sp. Z1748]|uniref:MerR family transcriptional regulator n=1 Tax=Pseudactinotalea sp. Z1748 TaxID=3413027 RepID=UPI003C7A03E4
MAAHMQIGEVSERTGLSQRTIRHYGEVGLVTPSSRTEGGFRLYTDSDVSKFELIKKMKPLEYSLEEMREVLDLIAELDTEPTASRRAELTSQLVALREAAATRRDGLAAQLAAAESFIAQLDQRSAQP